MKKTICLLILSFFAFGCSTQKTVRGPYKPKSIVTPWEYYQKARPAVFGEKDQAKVKKAAVHATGSDTREDKTRNILIGTLVGVVVIGGAVTGILIAK